MNGYLRNSFSERELSVYIFDKVFFIVARMWNHFMIFFGLYYIYKTFLQG